MTYKKIEPRVWKPEKAGDSVEGILVTVEPSKKFGGKIYGLELLSGDQIVVFGTTVLDDRMRYVKGGDKIKISFDGVEKNQKNQDTKIFSVFKDDLTEQAVA